MKVADHSVAEAALDACGGSGADRSGSDGDYNPELENAANARLNGLNRHDVREDRQHAADNYDSASAAAAQEGVSVHTEPCDDQVYFSESSKQSDMANATRAAQRKWADAPACDAFWRRTSEIVPSWMWWPSLADMRVMTGKQRTRRSRSDQCARCLALRKRYW